MESDRESLRHQLRAAERGEVVSWVVYPPTPVWWPVAFGLWAAALTLAIGLLPGLVLAVAELVLVGVMLAVVAWDRRRRGTYPTGRPPRELHGAVLRLLLRAAVVVAAVWLLGEQVDVWPGAALAGIGSWAVVARYEQEYAAIAARVRERLG